MHGSIAAAAAAAEDLGDVPERTDAGGSGCMPVSVQREREEEGWRREQVNVPEG